MKEDYLLNKQLLKIASEVKWKIEILDNILEGFYLVDDDKKEIWLSLVEKMIKEERLDLLELIVLKMKNIKNLDELKFYLSISDISNNIYLANLRNEYIANYMVALLRKKRLSSQTMTINCFNNRSF